MKNILVVVALLLVFVGFPALAGAGQVALGSSYLVTYGSDDETIFSNIKDLLLRQQYTEVLDFLNASLWSNEGPYPSPDFYGSVASYIVMQYNATGQKSEALKSAWEAANSLLTVINYCKASYTNFTDRSTLVETASNKEIAAGAVSRAAEIFSVYVRQIIDVFGLSPAGIPRAGKTGREFLAVLNSAEAKFGELAEIEAAKQLVQKEMSGDAITSPTLKAQPELVAALQESFFGTAIQTENQPEEPELTLKQTEQTEKLEEEGIILESGESNSTVFDFTGEHADQLGKQDEKEPFTVSSTLPEETSGVTEITPLPSTTPKLKSETPLSTASEEKKDETTLTKTPTEVPIGFNSNKVDETTPPSDKSSVPLVVSEEEKTILTEAPELSESLVVNEEATTPTETSEIVKLGVSSPGSYEAVDQLISYTASSNKKDRTEATASLGQLYLVWQEAGQGNELYQYLKPLRSQNKYLKGLVSWIETYYLN